MYFKKFLMERDLYKVFINLYRKNRMSKNPPEMEIYLEESNVESVILNAFLLTKDIFYGKDFWQPIQEEWTRKVELLRTARNEAELMERYNLEVIDLPERKSNLQGLAAGTCSLNLKNGNRLTLNQKDSNRVIKAKGTKLMLTQSRRTLDVVLMFNRSKGLDVKIKRQRNDKNNVQVNGKDLATNLIDLLGLDETEEYFVLHIEKLEETKEMVLFRVRQ